MLAEKSLNGARNPARPVAIARMAVLVASITSSWFIFSGNRALKKIPRQIIRFCGTGSMLAVIFLSSDYHDPVINVSASLGLIAFFVILKSLYNLLWKMLVYLGALIPLLIV